MPNRIDIKEFREKDIEVRLLLAGFLQEANRMFFHPHGLALEVLINEDGTESLGGVWDYRNDSEGIVFGDCLDREKARVVKDEQQRHAEARVALMGAVIQPLDYTPVPEGAEAPR